MIFLKFFDFFEIFEILIFFSIFQFFSIFRFFFEILKISIFCQIFDFFAKFFEIFEIINFWKILVEFFKIFGFRPYRVKFWSKSVKKGQNRPFWPFLKIWIFGFSPRFLAILGVDLENSTRKHCPIWKKWGMHHSRFSLNVQNVSQKWNRTFLSWWTRAWQKADWATYLNLCHIGLP